MIPTLHTLDETRWVGGDEWVQGISHYARHHIKRLFGFSEKDFAAQYPSGATILRSGREWRLLSKPNAEEWRGHPAPPKSSDGL